MDQRMASGLDCRINAIDANHLDASPQRKRPRHWRHDVGRVELQVVNRLPEALGDRGRSRELDLEANAAGAQLDDCIQLGARCRTVLAEVAPAAALRQSVR